MARNRMSTGAIIKTAGSSKVTAPATNAPRLPGLLINKGDLPATAYELRDHLATVDGLFERGGPVRLVLSGPSDIPSVHPLAVPNVVMEAHRVCRPYRLKPVTWEEVPETLPERLASMYLAMRGERKLRALDGITTAPILTDKGEIVYREGYDPATRLWCVRVPALAIHSSPTRQDAEAALGFIRDRFRTFPFADAIRIEDPKLGAAVVDTTRPPGADESAMLVGLLTAVARPSLSLAPGLLMTAPAVSGAGTGKGMLVRAICEIAFGLAPHAVTAGSERQELDKRIAAELLQAGPALFLDNLNGVSLRSDLLASVMTERPARVRVLGKSEMLELNSTAFVAVTGNGLTVSEDLARRFVTCKLDARTEDPEARPFASGFISEIRANRAKFLKAALTIWRWGRQNHATLIKGQPLGSFELWAEWVRDPLLNLGCIDPVLRVAEAKANDSNRRQISELFNVWFERHGDKPMKASDLHKDVVAIADPQARGRQLLTSYLDGLNGTRMAGLQLTRQKTDAKWSAATYTITRMA